MKSEKKVKKNKKKMGKLELVFDIFSVVFLVGFSVFYLSRAIIWKKELTPKKTSDGVKTELLVNKVISNNETVTSGTGLYLEDTNYIFKGDVKNNYVMYSNILYQIIKINTDKSIEMISADKINYMKIDEEYKEYKNSDIDRYLNSYYYKLIDNENISKSIVCLDKVNDITNITCNSKYAANVRLLNISDYVNSRVDNKTYLDSNYKMWLYNITDEKAWLVNDGNLLVDNFDNFYGIRPVITLSRNISFYKGTGTKDDPYVIESKKLYGSYVKLGDDIWQVYEEDDNNIMLVLNDLIDNGVTKYQFNGVDNTFDIDSVGVGKYLNSTYYNSLSYKDYLIDHKYYIGSYDDGLDKILENEVTVKVGMLDVTNTILNWDISNYYLLTKTGNKSVYTIQNGNIIYSNTTIPRNVRPTITITKKDLIGKGTLDEPYTKEVK